MASTGIHTPNRTQVNINDQFLMSPVDEHNSISAIRRYASKRVLSLNYAEDYLVSPTPGSSRRTKRVQLGETSTAPMFPVIRDIPVIPDLEPHVLQMQKRLDEVEVKYEMIQKQINALTRDKDLTRLRVVIEAVCSVYEVTPPGRQATNLLSHNDQRQLLQTDADLIKILTRGRDPKSCSKLFAFIGTRSSQGEGSIDAQSCAGVHTATANECLLAARNLDNEAAETWVQILAGDDNEWEQRKDMNILLLAKELRQKISSQKAFMDFRKKVLAESEKQDVLRAEEILSKAKKSPTVAVIEMEERLMRNMEERLMRKMEERLMRKMEERLMIKMDEGFLAMRADLIRSLRVTKNDDNGKHV